MVEPILLVALPLAAAFLLPLAGKLGLPFARLFHKAALVFGGGVALSWLFALGIDSGNYYDIRTGGWAPPWGILLRLGGPEAALIALADLVALLAAFYLDGRDRDGGGTRGLVIQLMIVLGAHGLILTRDLFNMFVFVEITAIGSYAILMHGREEGALEAGFKYMLVGALSSTLILLGTALLYRYSGTLYLADMATRLHAPALRATALPAIGLSQVLLLVGFMVELKLFPANGPAIDLYDAAEPGAMALIVGTAANAAFYAFAKAFALFEGPLASGEPFRNVTMTIGMITFVASNLLATRQSRARRMLGYSTTAQFGLLVFLLPLVNSHPELGSAVALLLVGHTIAKSGLLWAAGSVDGDSPEAWRAAFRGRPHALAGIIVLILSIVGLPPFPGFWGKWDALVTLSRDPHLAWWIVPVLVGSFLEIVYYFGFARRLFPATDEGEAAEKDASSAAPAAIAAVATVAIGFALGYQRLVAGRFEVAPAAALLTVGALLVILRFLPWRLLGVIALGAVGAVAATMSPIVFGGGYPVLALSFLILVGAGVFVVGIAALGYPKEDRGFWGYFLVLAASLALMVQSMAVPESRSLLLFFVAWEIMTWSSWSLVNLGKSASEPGYRYMLFSGAAGLLILGGFMLAGGSASELSAISGTKAIAAWIFIVLGIAVKLGSWGFHIWVKDAYAESPNVFTPFLSAVVSKAPIFGLVLLVSGLHGDLAPTAFGSIDLMHVLAWVGAITAVTMSVLAAIQEDAKRLLAYSSVAQVAYIVIGFAVASPLGWTAALYLTINHFLFKALLFLAIAGVIHRAGTGTLYELGGLIKRMPFSFVSVLVGIIAVSGVPPLSGFVGKWLIYEAMMAKGWYFLTGVTMFATMVAFLYLYRVIHTVFLGQLKAKHRTVREAPWPALVAQGILIASIMALSINPGIALEPLSAAIGLQGLSGAALTLGANGGLSTPLGYVNPLTTMLVVMTLFAILLAILLLLAPKPKLVKQLDMVYSAEVPPPPEEIHYAYAMFRPYERAMAPALAPRVTRFWKGTADTLGAIGDAGRRFYGGDAQTYLLYALALVVAVASIYLGGIR